MSESKTKVKAAKTLASKDTSKTAKKVAGKALASDKPNQAVAEAAVHESYVKGRALAKSIDIPHIADEATELVADGAEVVAEQFTNVAKVSRRVSGRDVSLVLLGLGVGAVAGGYVGFRIAEKRMRVKFDELLEEETVQVREHYHQKLMAHDAESQKPALSDLATFSQQQKTAEELPEELGYVPPSASATLSGKTPAQIMRDAPETEQMREVREEGERMVSEIEDVNPDRRGERAQFVRETQNIFAERDAKAPVWDYSTEIKSRNPAFPYVVHTDEYRENLLEHDQKDLTFYEGDGVLCGDNDVIVDDQDEAIGIDNLNRFGHGGADGNTVHVRNEVREIDYEVVRSHGSYSLEVHGIDPDETEDNIQHSDRSWRGRQTFEDD